MEDITRKRLLGDWKRIEDSEFYAEFRKLLHKEEIDLLTALRADSNDRDKDMFIKGKLYELDIVHRRLERLVKSIGGNVG